MKAPDPYRFLLRMPHELREPLREAAERGGRSLNAEIVARLEASVSGRRPRRQVRRPRLVPAIAVAGMLAVAASGALLQQRSTAASHHAGSARPAASRTLVDAPAYVVAKQSLANEPVYAAAR
jgi:Arc-like DNA binding domain